MNLQNDILSLSSTPSFLANGMGTEKLYNRITRDTDYQSNEKTQNNFFLSYNLKICCGNSTKSRIASCVLGVLISRTLPLFFMGRTDDGRFFMCEDTKKCSVDLFCITNKTELQSVGNNDIKVDFSENVIDENICKDILFKLGRKLSIQIDDKSFEDSFYHPWRDFKTTIDEIFKIPDVDSLSVSPIRIINENNPVCISYARNKIEERQHHADIRERLVKLFDLSGIRYVNDVENYDKQISTLEKLFGLCEVVVVILSDKYFKSEHCMFEWACIHHNHYENDGRKIIYVKYDEEKILLCDNNVLENGFNFGNANYEKNVNDYWKDKRTEYENGDCSVVQCRNAEHGFYLEHLRKMKNFFRETPYHKTSNICEFTILQEIKEWFESKYKCDEK